MNEADSVLASGAHTRNPPKDRNLGGRDSNVAVVAVADNLHRVERMQVAVE
jgi:hypothetical protein